MENQQEKKMKIKINDVLDKESYTNQKISEWFIKENCYNNKLLTDIGRVNVNKYYTKSDSKLTPVTDIFCDNIMVFTIVPVENTEKRNNMQMYKEKHCGIGNTYIRQILKDCNIKPEQINCKKQLIIKKKKMKKQILLL